MRIGWAPLRSRRLRRSSAEARDFVLETDRLRLVIGNDGSGIERHQRYGALIESGPRERAARTSCWSCAPCCTSPALRCRCARVGIDVSRAGERPVLTVEEASRDGRFELRTEYRLAPQHDFVELVTTRHQRERQARRRRAAGRSRALARHACVRAATWATCTSRRAPTCPGWDAPSAKRSYGFVFPERPAQTVVSVRRHGADGRGRAGRQRRTLRLAASSEFRRDADRGRGRARQVGARWLGSAWARRSATRAACCIPPQTWATISARHPDGRTVLSVPAAPDGQLRAAAAGRRVSLRAAGARR